MARFWILLSIGLHLFQCVLWHRHEMHIRFLRSDLSRQMVMMTSDNEDPSSGRTRRAAEPGPEVNGDGAIAGDVEFIHPKLRDEMEEIEKEDPNNPWVWLTSYSRIPVGSYYKFQSLARRQTRWYNIYYMTAVTSIS